MRFLKTVVVGVSMLGACAAGETIEAEYTGIAGGTSARHVKVRNEGTFYAGHMMHTITSGSRAGHSFGTFCVDVREYVRPGSLTYQVVDLADAPMPGDPYGRAKADAVSAVIANAMALGWLDKNLQADSGASDYLAKMGAIQAAVWGALGYQIRDDSWRTSSDLNTYYDILLHDDTFDSSLRTNGLRAMVAPNQQDMLYIVPLPPAAFAGAGVLAVGFGIRVMRRHKQA